MKWLLNFIMKVFKISLPGNQVQGAQLKDEVFDSQYPSPKVDVTANPPHLGIINVNWTTTTPVPFNTSKTLYSFPHNQNNIPAVLGAFKWDNGSNVVRGTMPFQMGALGMLILDADDTNVNLKYYSFDIFNAFTIPPFLMKVRFYVFAERAYE